MGLFNFLGNAVEDVAGGVFNFLAPGAMQRQQAQKKVEELENKIRTLPPGFQQLLSPQIDQLQREVPNPLEKAGKFGLSVIRAPIRAGASLGTSLYNLATPVTGLPKQEKAEPAVLGFLGKGLLGSEKVES